MSKNKFGRGIQVAYLPNHAEGNFENPDVEYGFVTSTRSNSDSWELVYCRFWHKGKPGEMRTTNCSEMANASNLMVYHSVDQSVVQEWLDKIDRGEA
jgi:hypothetical protein